MEKSNPWNNIPLDDYEQHMQHTSVAQAQLLNYLTDLYLEKYRPRNLLFLGVSGGNGLEHIDTKNTERVVAIDINEVYLEETRKRFQKKIKQLELVHVDIGSSSNRIIKADFIWAALIFEYVDIDKALNFIDLNASAAAHLVISIQSNNGAGSVSSTGIESVKSLKDIFRVVDGVALQKAAQAKGFCLIESVENILPNGKSFLTFDFVKTSH